MTRSDFIAAHRHAIAGLVLDAATNRASGAELSLFMRTILARVDTLLGDAYDDVTRQPVAPPANGQPKLAAPAAQPQVRK